MTIHCDVAILGGGTGGYVAAIRAAQLGKEVVIIEKDKLGGTCLHRGCIPSKALLRSAEVYATIKESAQYGIETSGAQLVFPKVQERKEAVVEQLHQGVQFLMRKNKITVLSGKGRVIGPSIFSPKSGAVAVELENGEMETIVPTHLIIATGSRPRVLSGLEPDGEFILSSDEALTMEELPASLIIVGGGVIGVEWASMLNDFGVEVTVVEAANRLIPTEDEDVSREMQRLLTKRGVKVLTGSQVLAKTYGKDEEGVQIDVQKGEETETLSASKLLISVGRQANVENIGLENTDIRVERGFISVNEHLQTNEPHIYAIGDCIGGLQLAHAASHEGLQAVHHMAGEEFHSVPNHLIPRCIYTRPEAASVGLTEQEARERGHQVKTGKFPFQAIGKSLVYGSRDGFVKVVADEKTNDILGVHMIGTHVTDLISEAALAQLLDATPWEVGQLIHPHPTLSEILGEAMLAVDGQAIGI
ncbi:MULTISPECIES: dihydrolipoyl dehydrogenase [Paenibacillus]|jgi:dihydrolipoamide dehydrogenase|uniref:Dihydrolipoyl dehydrogenase n=2 Tax=Paenibacillus TaxID=44249 RepID=A0ABX2Z717_PAEPO|nr:MULTISPECIES: dihydrolipoyl dehydrogenase [Paenibacillus]AIW40534.1 dihydrolipoamide dehydrogenase [Paenibacillus polymyxa CR1]MCP3743314.1 dihydrolipoyl dehydrogenase [Paenibacillus sp. A3M_27_13]MDR6776552.1 dihydrolipoamide dehydrogenase [Paenibacillus peoriae]ODA07047.1 dihydrolipoyl dehydrogenase [Paenibacillus polymyxa]OME72714.1 dihydrolipoyl dehydrogenase [Paenibacillus peoriae]